MLFIRQGSILSCGKIQASEPDTPRCEYCLDNSFVLPVHSGSKGTCQETPRDTSSLAYGLHELGRLLTLAEPWLSQ